MFDRSIIETDSFSDLPMSAKALYFLLGMEADDEGFVSPKRILKIYGGTDDDIKVLIAKKFLIPFDSGVVVITDWNNNNWLDNRRVKATVYVQEKALLGINSEKKYELLSNGLASAKRVQNSIEEKSTVENRKEEKNKYFLFNKNKQEYEHVSFSSKKASTLWATEKKDWLGDDFFALETHEKLSDGTYKRI